MAKGKKKTEETSEALEVTGPQDLSNISYGDDAGEGVKDLGKEYYLVPFWALLQSNSPQCKGRDPLGRPGQFFNTVTEEVRDELVGTMVKVERAAIEWVPRNQGGGFVAKHDPNSAAVKQAWEAWREKRQNDEKKKVKPTLENGNEVIETFEVLFVDDEDGSGAILSATSTKIRPVRRYLTTIGKVQVGPANNRHQPPMYAHHVRILSVEEQNSEGDYYNIRLEPAEAGADGKPNVYASLLTMDDPRYESAKAFHEMVASGDAKVDHEAAASKTGGVDGDETEPF